MANKLFEAGINVRIVNLPEKYKDVCEYFFDNHSKEDFTKLCNIANRFEGSQSNSVTVIPNAIEFMDIEFGDIDWLVKDIIPTGGSAIVVAKRESYKTWLVLYLAHCITKGESLWDTFPTHKDKVLYISNDDPARNFQKRLCNFTFNDSFFVYHQNLTPFSIDQDNGSFESVKQLIKDNVIGLVIIDILRNTHNKDSNTDKDSKLVFDKYKELRTSNPNLVFIFVMHPSKEQSVEKRFGARQSEEAIGSYYWEAAVDTVISLTKTADEDTHKVVITLTKNKQSEKKIKSFVGIRRIGEGSVEFVYEEKVPDKLKLAQAKEYILELLAKQNYKRQEIIDILVENKICATRLAEQALKELVDEKSVFHTSRKPHVYSLNEDGVNDSANRNPIYGVRNAKTSTQAEISFLEEADGK